MTTLSARATSSKVPPRTPIDAVFARAVELAGGEKKLANCTSMVPENIHDVLWGGVTIEADFCPEVERASRLKVTCEELRPDLIWHRDGAGEPLGYTTPVGTSREVLAVALAKDESTSAETLVDGKWDAMSYRAGILHGVSQEERDSLYAVYGPNRDWTSYDTLDSLMADVEDWKSDGVFHQCFGMLWDLDEETREALLKEAGVCLSRDWDGAKTDELWAKAQAIRAEKPHLSTAAAPAFASGMTAVVAKYGRDLYFRKFHGVDHQQKQWAPTDFDDLSSHVRSTVLDESLKNDRRNWSSWSNLLVGDTYEVSSQVGFDVAERVGKTAASLLETIVPGLEALHDYQFAVLTSDLAGSLDEASPIRLCAFQMCMQEAVNRLIGLRETMAVRQRELEG